MVVVANIVQMVESEATKAGVDPYTILGIIKVESNFNPKAFKYEPGYLNFFKTKEYAILQGIDEVSERWSQKVSVGLMQLMFSTGRWLGYSGFFCDFFDPILNVQYGIKYFQKIMSRHNYLNDQIATYNWGHVEKKADGSYVNQQYVDSVLQSIEEMKKDLMAQSQMN